MATQIFSSAALKTRQREIKDAALNDVVHITENGNAAFIFCSETIFDQMLKEAAEEAAYNERLAAALRESRADIEAGRCIEGTEAALEKIELLRKKRIGACA